VEYGIQGSDKMRLELRRIQEQGRKVHTIVSPVLRGLLFAILRPLTKVPKAESRSRT
jgi:hypothetical protein